MHKLVGVGDENSVKTPKFILFNKKATNKLQCFGRIITTYRPKYGWIV